MSEGVRARDAGATVTASVNEVSAASLRIARGLADLMGDPAGDELPPGLVALLSALDAPTAGAAAGREAIPA